MMFYTMLQYTVIHTYIYIYTYIYIIQREREIERERDIDIDVDIYVDVDIDRDHTVRCQTYDTGVYYSLLLALKLERYREY